MTKEDFTGKKGEQRMNIQLQALRDELEHEYKKNQAKSMHKSQQEEK
jgi:hypothetical protein